MFKLDVTQEDIELMTAAFVALQRKINATVGKLNDQVTRQQMELASKHGSDAGGDGR